MKNHHCYTKISYWLTAGILSNLWIQIRFKKPNKHCKTPYELCRFITKSNIVHMEVRNECPLCDCNIFVPENVKKKVKRVHIT